MAKMRKKRERKARKAVAKTARGLLAILEAKEAATSPHTYMAKKTLERLSKLDKVNMRRGVVRKRKQFLNPRNGRYYVMDDKGRILYGGKRSPYKNIRMVKH